jgi:DNA mismatch repair protein MutL
MALIKILPENIAAKIAAGEVVQRPESVVKELMENSIDAGADTIDLMIKRAGKSLVQVCDNGTGMSEEDALLCIQKHATSKISTINDLESISTLGFRGEALSSITSVAQVEIRTELRDEEIGTHIRIEDSKNVIKEKGSFAKGTCVLIKNIFFNIPARRNFLKSDATELKHIVDTFNKIALSHQDLNFRFYNENDLIFNYAAGDISNRVRQVFADNMLEALIPVEEKTDFLSVYGYVGKPEILKKSRGDQYIFLNSRYVISRQINHAVFTAYDDFLEKGDYPFFILFIEIDPKKIDVNVHPSKLEVRFDDERDVYNFVLAVVKKSLGSRNLIPGMTFDSNPGNSTPKKDKNVEAYFADGQTPGNMKSFTGTGFTDKDIDLIFNGIPDDAIKREPGNMAHPFENMPKEIYHEVPEENRNNLNEEPAFIIQLHNRYILSQIKSGLMIIDQQVAHERVLYEKALKRMEADLPFSQQLLFPKTLEANPGIIAVLKDIQPYLIRLGFNFRFSGRNNIIIEGVPEDVKHGAEEFVLLELVNEFLNNESEKKPDLTDNIAKSYSCKAAIKAGDKLSEKEMRLLIDQLFATSMPYVCPNGRPVVVKISLDEFDRRFGK